jgi:two-component system chemotaxis sensor kinase CheA
VEIEDSGYVLRSQIGATLKNVFTHLVRNSVDHGLETPEERQAASKPAAGTITLRLSVDGPMLRIGLKDDGRGLALAKILERAVEAGKVEAGTKLSDESIADLVFLPGLSTATSVSEVSGRGVGMDAAINFIRAEQGSIKIHFFDDAVGAPFRQFETVVYLPLRFAEHLEAPLSADVGATQRLVAQAVAAV